VAIPGWVSLLFCPTLLPVVESSLAPLPSGGHSHLWETWGLPTPVHEATATAAKGSKSHKEAEEK
jgi:hypothetical protein